MIYKGWKEICKFIDASPNNIKKAIKEKNLPIKYPCGKPQLVENEYEEWLKTQPPGHY
jgi:hypothetical protein